MEYLDKTGLAYLWSKLKAVFAKKSELPKVKLYVDNSGYISIDYGSDS